MKNIFLHGLIVLFIVSLLWSCKKESEDSIAQPDFIKTSLPVSLAIDGGQEFEFYIANATEGVVYQWELPDMLTLISGQGTNRITVQGSVEGGLIPVKSLGVTAVKNKKRSYTRWFYKEITILTPPPSLDNYKTKRFGSKTWMIENLNEKGVDGNLGWAYDNNENKSAIYGRLYTWAEALTGISKATVAQNPYKFGYAGVDDAGNAFKFDGTTASSANIQIQGACPKGWHLANANDWYDLLVAIKAEYNISGSVLSDVGSSKDGYIIGWGREVGVVNSITLTNWGIVGPYLKGSSPQSAGGLWEGGTTFNYGGNSNFPSGAYPLFKELSEQIDFNILPNGRWNEASKAFQQEGLYSYHWVPFLSANVGNNPLRLTIGAGNANFSNGTDSGLNGYCIRCVANYID
ncbi:FISUMP domain-containing protein [Sphingobacterium luzhongxinii]|uniref:FISUMP domain-containing protein n=1 Tax=Sphingobacterium luzhongxinii TaxID=2654181 RepID=UPI0013DC1905|nr:FISUMP domain-containing protein [Sphingobacterium sp. xlx-73]